MLVDDLTLVLTCASVLGLLYGALSSSGKGDLGNGLRQVILPKPETRLRRVWAFVLLTLAWSAWIAIDFKAVTVPVRWLLYHLLLFAGAGVLAATSYVAHVDPLLFFLILGALVALQVTRAHSWFSLLGGCAILLVFVLGAPVLTSVVLVILSFLFVPTSIVYFLFDFVTLAVGFLALLALIFSTTFLPRRYRFSARTSSLRGVGLMVLIAIVVLVVAGSSFHLLGAYFLRAIPASGLIVFLMIPTIFTLFEVVLLTIRRKEVPGIADGVLVPIDVIMPAFNEELSIGATIRAIDRAAGLYGGRVRIFVADDGSSDATLEVLHQLVGDVQALEIFPLVGRHGGKAVALNRALAATSAEIVVRIDADILVDERVFVALPDWFANPNIGCVGAFDLPNPDLPAWYTKGRLFECLMTFGFTRLAYERLDANNIPGTFMAFRRRDALDVSGFVEGMNGEDSDLTFNLGRLGLVSVIDRGVVIYEDVPQTASAFLEQRTRWSRASFHVAARHFPGAAYDVTPRYLVQLRFLFNKLSALMRPITYVSAVIFFLLVPHGNISPLRVLVLLAIGLVPQYLVLVAVTLYYGYWRDLPYSVIWLPFTVLRKIGLLSGLFSLPPYRGVAKRWVDSSRDELVGVRHER